MSQLLTSFPICREKMDLFRPMADPGGVGNIEDEWPNNLLSTQTVIYGDGKFGKYGEQVRHLVDPHEWELCKALSLRAQERATDVFIPSETQCPLGPFYVVRNADEPPSREITSDVVRDVFAGTLFPLAPIVVDPLSVEEPWWSDVVGTEDDEKDTWYAEFMGRWREVVNWFQNEKDFINPVFVRVGDDSLSWELDRREYPPGTEMIGCCFPRLILALTPNGSLVGLAGYAVLT